MKRFKKRNQRRDSSRNLTIESLENRELMSVDLVGTQLQIEGTPGDDVCTVSTMRFAPGAGFADIISVNLNGDRHSFADSAVRSIKFEGHDGNDQFTKYWNTGQRCYVYGGDDNDTVRLYGSTNYNRVYGGSGDDEIHGGGGRDYLYGGRDNDQIWGGGGNDWIRGQGGHDDLYGGPGRDVIKGESGHDRLRGEEGNDTLEGGPGIDSLLGGAGTDVVEGGPQDDRFLVETSSTDHIRDLGSDDVRINFADGEGFTWRGTDGTVTRFAAGSWTTDDIDVVDKAFEQLQRRTLNTDLLKTSSGGELTFERHGDHVSGRRIRGWNDDLGTIALTQIRFDGPDDGVMQTVFHEIGHNWDEQSENDDIDDFRAISGWTEVNPRSFRYRTSRDGNWWHLRSAAFSREYGRTNPREDFATAFAAYFAQYGSTDYSDGDGAIAIPDKIAAIDRFLEDLM
jgi:hypothetical protein